MIKKTIILLFACGAINSLYALEYAQETNIKPLARRGEVLKYINTHYRNLHTRERESLTSEQFLSFVRANRTQMTQEDIERLLYRDLDTWPYADVQAVLSSFLDNSKGLDFLVDDFTWREILKKSAEAGNLTFILPIMNKISDTNQHDVFTVLKNMLDAVGRSKITERQYIDCLRSLSPTPQTKVKLHHSIKLKQTVGGYTWGSYQQKMMLELERLCLEDEILESPTSGSLSIGASAEMTVIDPDELLYSILSMKYECHFDISGALKDSLKNASDTSHLPSQSAIDTLFVSIPDLKGPYEDKAKYISCKLFKFINDLELKVSPWAIARARKRLHDLSMLFSEQTYDSWSDVLRTFDRLSFKTPALLILK